MKKLTYLLVMLSLLASCAVQTSEPVPGQSETAPTESWTLLEKDYMPIYEDPCDEIEFPEFDGMTEEEYYDRARELGFDGVTGPYFIWAEGGKHSPTGRYLAYGSNKDCLNSENRDGYSTFLLDTETGEECVLLSGSDGSYYVMISWLDNETILCLEASRDSVYVACGIDGTVAKLEDISNVFGLYDRYFVETFESELRACYIETDGSITEITKTQFDGDQLMYCGISPDGKFICYIEQSDVGLEEPEYERKIILWSTADGTQQTLSQPVMTQGEDTAAISAQWQDGGFAIDFHVSDAPDENGHNELWSYQNSMF